MTDLTKLTVDELLPVTDGVPPDLAAALAWWGDGTEPKTMAEAVEKARSYRNDAHELADVSFELRNQPEGNPAEQVRRLLAPVTDAEVEAAIAVWPMVPICVFCSKVLSGAAGKDAAFATAAKHAVECAENPLMRERDEANRRVAKAESDRAYLDEKLESIEYALADDIKGEHGRVDGDSVLRVIARRVAEARGAGLWELRARLVDFCRIRDRGYDVRSDFSPLWVLDEIDRLLAAPPASKLAEEPAQESKTDLSWRSEFADLKRVTHAEWLRHDKLIVAIHAQVERVARRIEALENNKEAGK